MTISFAVTAYNEMSEGRGRGQKIRECIQAAKDHEGVDEIVIVNDGSEDFDQLFGVVLSTQPEKVKLTHNPTNQGVFGNKLEAIARCEGEWVITCDSDNKMDEAYLSRLTTNDLDPSTWYCPSFARPQFDYRELVGDYGLKDIVRISDHPMLGCCLNTGNQTVHRQRFMEVFEEYRGKRFDLMLPNYLNLPDDQRASEHWKQVWNANDSLIFNMEWLSADNRIQVVEDLEYDHHYTPGPDSNYARAPTEKTQLNQALVAELLDRSRKAR
jgi:glycosyltransferase involved in cell wall biosynthesis